jgi:signal transduction histidine kinase
MTRVLIVDDKEDNLRRLQALLSAQGWIVDTARHGAEALASAKQTSPAFVVADLLMAVMDGCALLRDWKADPALGRIPLIVYAPADAGEEERLARRLGADAFVLGSADPEALLAEVRRVLASVDGPSGAPLRPADENRAGLEADDARLFQRLEEKSLELDASERALQKELADREPWEAERQTLLHDLGERIKELGALRAASAMLQDTSLPPGDLLQGIADLLPPAMQFPEITAARVSVDDTVRLTPGFRETEAVLAARFVTSDGAVGAIEVVYLEPRRPEQIGPFLAEEDHLLQSLADMLRLHVERRRADAALRASEALLRSASRIARLGAWAVQLPEGAVVWSDELRALLDVPPGVMPANRDAIALCPPEWRERLVPAYEALVREGAPFDVEVEVLTMTGRRLWVRICGEAERQPDGTITRLQGTLQDLTERKALEQQALRAQRIESIGTLAGGIAHDLNNVLAPIVLSIEMLREGGTDEQRREMLASIEASATRGAEMVRQVLAFARGVEGQRTRVNVAHVVRDVEKIASDTFLKTIEVTANLPARLPPVIGDPTQLHQVLLNLCVNARDAMTKGGRLSIAAAPVVLSEADAARHPGTRPGLHVVISVEDTGCGMSQATLDRVFEPFFTTKDVGQGTGLGLPTSLAIVRSHQGFIDVVSRPGEGTRFSVYLPAEVVAAAEPPLASDPRPPRGEGELILVVDDEPLVREMLRQTLELSGYRALIAADGSEAVAAYSRRRGDIAAVITDMMMPVMDGAATIAALVALDPGVRVIGTSGLGLDGQALPGDTAGVASFLAKPYTTEALLRTLHHVIHGPARPS